MKIGVLSSIFVAAAILAASASRAGPRIDAKAHAGLAGDTLLIIRHAEKPADKTQGGVGLTPAGEARARAYADYFRHLRVDGVPVRLNALVATADSANSARPRLTLTPLSKATDLPIQQPFADKQVDALADWLAQGAPNRSILIAWHHHRLPELLAALGADPAALIPGGTWPDDTYNWVMVLRYDAQGRFKSAERVIEPVLNAYATTGSN